MKYKFTLTEFIKEWARIDDKYGYVEVKKEYVCSTYDDLQNIFLTLVDFSQAPLKFEVKKEVIEEDEDA